MSIQHLAEHVRTHGRGEDTMLVHMTPREVAGLQTIAERHGGSLTINPKTGMPEAGFLSSILPVIAGIGLSFVPGVGPLMAAGLVGGGGALATGSIQKGLMMGLGAFGGAGLAGGIAKMGLGALAGEGAVLAGSAGAEAAATTAASAFPAAATMPSTAALSAAANTAQAAATPALTSGVNSAASQALSQAAKQTITQPPVGMASQFMNNAQQFPGKVGMAFNDPSRFMDATGGMLKTGMYGAAAATPMLSELSAQRKIPNQDNGSDTPMPELSGNFYGAPMYSGKPNPISYPYKTHFNTGGVTSLGAYSDGGQAVVGPGDGMSDSIPARMSSGQEARLTDGEFVVPADVVSGLGNGSTKAGTALLYNMLDKVRQARTGKKVQPKAKPMHRMLPA